jgi:hypothetical protein
MAGTSPAMTSQRGCPWHRDARGCVSRRTGSHSSRPRRSACQRVARAPQAARHRPASVPRIPTECAAPTHRPNNCEWTRSFCARTIMVTETSSATRSGFQADLYAGALLSAPFPRSEACRAKGNRMRVLVEPPPWSQCDKCGGELRLKLIEQADPTLDLEHEIFVCVSCGCEKWYTVDHNRQSPHSKVA